MLARLLASVAVPHARQLVNAQDTALRMDGTALISIIEGDDLVAYRLDALLAGNVQPAGRFPVPAESFKHGAMVMPDLAGAVFPMRDESSGVCLVDASGAVRWHWRYAYCEGDVLVSADGRWVWTVLAEGSDGVIDGPVSVVVLDSTDGRQVASVEMPYSNLLEDQLVKHPDGQHVAVLGAREGEEGPRWSTAYWVRREPGGGLELREYPTESEELTGFDPSGATVAMTDVYGTFLRLRRFDTGAPLLTVHAGASDEFAMYTGFLDASTVLASCGAGEDSATHWLLDAPAAGEQLIERTLGDPGTDTVRYPEVGSSHPMPHMWALGNGTWLTADPDTLYLWTTAID